jgi:hypothetical protein
VSTEAAPTVSTNAITMPTRHCSSEGEQAAAFGESPDLRKVADAAREGGELYGLLEEDVGRVGSQGREVVVQVWVAQLSHPLGTRQIAQRMTAEVDQPRLFG